MVDSGDNVYEGLPIISRSFRRGERCEWRVREVGMRPGPFLSVQALNQRLDPDSPGRTLDPGPGLAVWLYYTFKLYF